MDQVDALAMQTILDRVARRALGVMGVHDRVLAFDTTNSFTYIASDDCRRSCPSGATQRSSATTYAR